MIRLNKGNQPNVLSQHAQTWTNELTAAMLSGTATEYQKGRYRHDEIKSALIAETNGKCAYCESKVLHNSYGDIEHIIPKDNQPNLYFDWVNLTLACDVCNTKKGTLNGVLDPYAVDPRDHFIFLGPSIFGKPLFEQARFTEKALRLNRVDLLERRMERLKYIREIFEEALRLAGVERQALLEFVDEESSAKEPYSAFAQSLVAELKAEHGIPD